MQLNGVNSWLDSGEEKISELLDIETIKWSTEGGKRKRNEWTEH